MWDLASPQEALGFTKFDNIQRTFLKHPAKKLNFPLEGGYGRKLIFLSSVVSPTVPYAPDCKRECVTLRQHSIEF